MSMTREEAITCLQEKYDYIKSFYDLAAHPKKDYPGMTKYLQALQIVLSALSPITKEQVEKVWRGEWEEERFASEHEGWQHRECGRHSTEKTKWCPKCGKAMTDEAVDMVMERLEALYEET